MKEFAHTGIRAVIRVEHGDMLNVVPRLVAEGVSVDAVVTDPPYDLLSVSRNGSARSNDLATPFGRTDQGGFMNMRWDATGIAFLPDTWAACLGILRPGGFLLAFGGTRTQHRMVCAIEDAGFVIQDQIDWIYGSGFPKNKQSLKPAHEPICVAYKPGGKRTLQVEECRISTDERGTPKFENGRIDRTQWRMAGGTSGNGPISALGRWPANIIHDGSGEVLDAFAAFGEKMHGAGHARTGKYGGEYDASSYHLGENGVREMGRFGDAGSPARFFMSCTRSEGEGCGYEPVNFADACTNLSSEAAVSVLGHAVARSTAGLALRFGNYRAHSTSVTQNELESVCACVTGTIRCFAERFSRGLTPENTTATVGPAKCAAVPEPTGTMTITISLWTSNGFAERATFSITPPNMGHGDQVSANQRFWYSSKAGPQDRWGSHHPTVKPIELIKYLVQLVCPPAGTFLDPFAGSGTAGVAALATGRNAILIEQDGGYVADIRERLAFYEGEGRHSLSSKNRNRASRDTPGLLL